MLRVQYAEEVTHRSNTIVKGSERLEGAGGQVKVALNTRSQYI